MDFKFMWYATATVVSNILPKRHKYLSHSEVVLLQREIKDKYMRYNVSIDGDVFLYTYTFFSNVCAVGSLEIIDVCANRQHNYGVERVNDTIRVYRDPKNYDELVDSGPGTILDIQVDDNIKTCISTMLSTQLTDSVFDMLTTPTAVTDTQRTNFTTCIKNELFLVTGALDYKNITCYDVVHFEDRKSQIVIYAEANIQVPILHTFGPNYAYGDVKPVNTDFKNQHVDYTRTDNNSFHIKEYFVGSDDSPILKREYDLINENENMIFIPIRKLRYNIGLSKNNVVFTRV